MRQMALTAIAFGPIAGLTLPGMCTTETHDLFSMEKFHILQPILLSVSFFIPLILIM